MINKMTEVALINIPVPSVSVEDQLKPLPPVSEPTSQEEALEEFQKKFKVNGVQEVNFDPVFMQQVNGDIKKWTITNINAFFQRLYRCFYEIGNRRIGNFNGHLFNFIPNNIDHFPLLVKEMDNLIKCIKLNYAKEVTLYNNFIKTIRYINKLLSVIPMSLNVYPHDYYSPHFENSILAQIGSVIPMLRQLIVQTQTIGPSAETIFQSYQNRLKILTQPILELFSYSNVPITTQIGDIVTEQDCIYFQQAMRLLIDHLINKYNVKIGDLVNLSHAYEEKINLYVQENMRINTEIIEQDYTLKKANEQIEILTEAIQKNNPSLVMQNNQHLNYLEEKVNELSQSVAVKNQEINMLTDQLTQMSVPTPIGPQLPLFDEEEYKYKINELNDYLAEKDLQMIGLDSEIKSLQEANANLTEQVQNLPKEKDAIINDLQQQVENLTKEKNDFLKRGKEQYDQVLLEKTQLQQQLETLVNQKSQGLGNEALNSIKEQLSQLNIEKSQLLEQVEQLKKENADIRTKCNIHLTETGTLTNKIKELQERMTQLLNEKTQLQQQIEPLMADQKTLIESKKQLEEQLRNEYNQKDKEALKRYEKKFDEETERLRKEFQEKYDQDFAALRRQTPTSQEAADKIKFYEEELRKYEEREQGYEYTPTTNDELWQSWYNKQGDFIKTATADCFYWHDQFIPQHFNKIIPDEIFISPQTMFMYITIKKIHNAYTQKHREATNGLKQKLQKCINELKITNGRYQQNKKQVSDLVNEMEKMKKLYKR